MGVYREVFGSFGTEGGLGGAIFHEVSGHPVVFAAGETFYRFAPIAPVELGAAFAGRPDKAHGEAGLEGKRDECCFAIPGDPFYAYVFSIDHWFARFEIVQGSCGSPGPGAKGAPVVRLTGLSFVDKTDDAPGEAGPIVCLYAVGVYQYISPSVRDQLLSRGRIAGSAR